MIGAVVENIIGGYLHPRASVRRLLAAGHGFEAAIQLAVLAFLFREIFMVVTPGARPPGMSMTVVGYFIELFDAMISLAVFATLACYVGRMFGGRGTLKDSAIVLAWYSVVTSFIIPLAMPALIRIFEAAASSAADPGAAVEMPAGPALIVLATSGIFMWLLAAYIAELHGFARTLGVLSVIIGMALALSLAVSTVVPLN